MCQILLLYVSLIHFLVEAQINDYHLSVVEANNSVEKCANGNIKFHHLMLIPLPELKCEIQGRGNVLGLFQNKLL